MYVQSIWQIFSQPRIRSYFLVIFPVRRVGPLVSRRHHFLNVAWRRNSNNKRRVANRSSLLPPPPPQLRATRRPVWSSSTN
jgi:hypothetical protein